MTTLQISITRPGAEEMEYLWKLFHAAQRNDSRWFGSSLGSIAEELSYCPNLERKEKLFLLRAWQVLVDDIGGFGRFMSAFDTYVYNMQDPNSDCVAWKPELSALLNDGSLLAVLLEAYADAKKAHSVENEELIRRIDELEKSHAQVIQSRNHYKRMLEEGLKDLRALKMSSDWINNCDQTVPAALRYLADNPRPAGGNSSYNAEHLIALAHEIQLTANQTKRLTVKLSADKEPEQEVSGYDGAEFYRAGWNARGQADREAIRASGLEVEGE